MKTYVFSYGTLQRKDVQADLFGRTLVGHDDVLSGYRLVEVDIEDPAFLARCEAKRQLTAVVSTNESDAIAGMAFEITEDELRVADNYEPAGYIRVSIRLDSGRDAWLYVAG